jgi:HK97 family phage major capsid protein
MNMRTTTGYTPDQQYQRDRAALVEQRTGIVGKAADLAGRCRGRDFTHSEEVDALNLKRQADDIDRQIERLDADEQRRRTGDAQQRTDQKAHDAAMMAKINELFGGLGMVGVPSPAGHPKIKAVGGSEWGGVLVRHHTDPMGNTKALLPSGAVPVTVPLAAEPVRMGEPVLSLRQVIPTVADPVGRWSYLRQTQRQNNASVVAPGARKPTSPFSLERVDGRAVTLATLSEPLHRADLADAEMLRTFIDTELRLAVETTLEDEIVNGSGEGEHFEGLATTSGTQAQAWTTDALSTTRAALTKLENMSLAGSAYVLSPADWETIELSQNTGGYALAQGGAGVPVDRAARRLWSVPVVVSTTVPAGTGFLIDAGSVELRIREEAVIDWSENLYNPDQFGPGDGGSLFEANMIVFRCEMRAGWAVKRPPGIVEIDLTVA